MWRLQLFLTLLILISLTEIVSGDYGAITGKIIPFTVSYYPDSPIQDTSPSTITFNVATDRIANFTWYFDGNMEKNDLNVSSSSFTKTAGEGTHNVTVTVMAKDTKDTLEILWLWEVSAAPPPQETLSRSEGGGGGGMLFLLSTPTPTPESTPEIITSLITVSSVQSTPMPTPTQATPSEVDKAIPAPSSVESKSPPSPPVTMDFSYGSEFFKWFRSVLMVSASFVLAYFGKNY